MTPGPKFIMGEKLKLTESDIARISEDPLTLFYNSLKSPYTVKNYDRNLRSFFCDVLEDVLSGTYEERAKQFVELAKEPEKLNNILYGYVINLKKHTELPVTDPEYMAIKTIKNRIKPITKFCDISDIPFNWRRLRGLFPENRNDYPEMRGYTKEEIQTMLKYVPGPRDKAIILIAASSGIRTGAFDFCWGDVRTIYTINGKLVVGNENVDEKNVKLECATIVVYKGSPDVYDAFITPEAYHALLEYKNLWTFELKTTPQDSDFVFKKAGPKKELLDRVAITRSIQKIRSRSGLESKLRSSKRRMQVPVMHGFRKFFNKTIKNTPSGSEFIGQYILKERMMGHASLVELDKNYYNENLIEKAQEYIKSVARLTISQDLELKEKNIILEQEKIDLQKEIPRLVNNSIEKHLQQLIEQGWAFPKDNPKSNVTN